jgi:hypothetical protein
MSPVARIIELRELVQKASQTNSVRLSEAILRYLDKNITKEMATTPDFVQVLQGFKWIPTTQAGLAKT